MKTIVWDIDDVLNNVTEMWLESHWLPAHPDCSVQYEDLTENPPHELLKTTKKEYLLSLDAFRLSPAAGTMIPQARLIEWFRNNGLRFRHIALTARPREAVSPAIEWMLRYFGQWFQTFSFVPAERSGTSPGHPDRDKTDFLLWLGKADYFIDDSPDNVTAAERIGISAFAPARPWNSSRLTLMDILEIIVKKDTSV